MPLLRQLIDERFSATGYGLLDLVSTTADGIMVYIGGALMEAHVDLARIFQWACVGLFIAGLLLFVIPIPRRGRRSDSAPAQIAPTQSPSPGSIPVSCWTIARSAITARTG